MKSRARLRFGGTFGMAMLALIAAIVIVPLYWLVVASTKGNSTLFSSSTFLPGSFSALGNNISQLFTVQDGVFGRWLINSAIYGLVTATLGTYLCTLTGYAVAMFRFR